MSNLVILLAIISINLFLLALVLKRLRNNSSNIAFSVVILSAIAWAVCNYFADFKNLSESFAVWMSRGSFLSAGILVLSFFFFCHYFPVKPHSFLKNFKIIVIPFSALVVLLTFTPYIISGVIEKDWGWDIVQGELYYLYVSYILVVSVFAFIILLSKYRSLKGISRLQIRYMFFGTFLTAFFATLTNLVLPLIMGTNPLAKYGAYSLLFLIGFTTYTIVKHRLMDIRFVVARSVTYTLVLVILAGFYAGSVLGIERVFFANTFDKINITQGAIRTVLAVVMAFSFQPLRRWITKSTDKIFFKNAYSPEQLLDTLSHTMSSTILLGDLLSKVTQTLIDEMKISRGLFVLLKDEDKIFTQLATGYKEHEEPEIEIAEIVKLSKGETIVYDELEENSHYKTILRKYQAAVSIPLRTEKGVEGVFLVGEKSSGDMFSQGDLRILEIIGPEIAVAIENAKSYEEISRFNVTLRQEVERATKRLKEKNEQLRELDIAKDEFISMASHQLRTPLTAIKGYLSMLLDGDAGEIKVGQYDFIHEAYSGANRMVGLINDLLNVSRMETGRFFIEPIEVDIVQAIKEEARQLDNAAKEKGIYLKLDLSSRVPHIWVDEMKLRQVIMNLIDNAVHYTQKGGVTVNLRQEKGFLVFEVHDTGIGIPAEQQSSLFEKFYRADNARHIRPDGTGLGIYLAKRVVEDHGGVITFQSVEGKGSTFGFKLPMKAITKKGSEKGSSIMPKKTMTEEQVEASTEKKAAMEELVETKTNL